MLGLKHLCSFGNLPFFDCAGIRLFLSEAEDADGAEEWMAAFKDNAGRPLAILSRVRQP